MVSEIAFGRPVVPDESATQQTFCSSAKPCGGLATMTLPLAGEPRVIDQGLPLSGNKGHPWLVQIEPHRKLSATMSSGLAAFRHRVAEPKQRRTENHLADGTVDRETDQRTGLWRRARECAAAARRMPCAIMS